MNEVPSNPRILIVKMSSLGDLFHALPTVHELKVGLQATVDWVVQPEYADLARCFTDVDRVLVFPRRGFWKGIVGFTRMLREREYDLIIDLQGLMKSALVTRLARGPRRIGPSFHREGAHLFYSEVAGARNKERHAVEEVLDVVRHLGLEVHAPVFPVTFPKKTLVERAPRVALVPCSRWITKNWPAERFVEVGFELQKRAGATIFLAGSKADIEVCRRIETKLARNVVNTAGQTSLAGLGSLLQEMDLVITVDSGPMHVAAAVGRPVLALFGATDPKRTGPYGSQHRIVVSPAAACRPCFSGSCREGKMSCLLDISSAEVVQTALDMLGIAAR